MKPETIRPPTTSLRATLALAAWLGLAWLPAATLAAPAEDAAGLEQLRRAAEGGDANAMFDLGILYEFGFRMPDHKAPALTWYRLAFEAGNAKAGARHDALKATMTGKEIDEANKLYAEYAALVRKAGPAPATPPVTSPPGQAAAPATAPPPPTNSQN